jgi:hypothetical protein
MQDCETPPPLHPALSGSDAVLCLGLGDAPAAGPEVRQNMLIRRVHRTRDSKSEAGGESGERAASDEYAAKPSRASRASDIFDAPPVSRVQASAARETTARSEASAAGTAGVAGTAAAAAAASAGGKQGWQGRRGARGAGRQKRAPRGGARGAVKKCGALLGSMMMSILFDLSVRTGSAWPGRGPAT